MPQRAQSGDVVFWYSGIPCGDGLEELLLAAVQLSVSALWLHTWSCDSVEQERGATVGGKKQETVENIGVWPRDLCSLAAVSLVPCFVKMLFLGFFFIFIFGLGSF